MNNRTAIYSKDRQSRVISVANGQWQLQGCSGMTGGKALDPWFKRGEPCDRDIAIMNMGQ